MAKITGILCQMITGNVSGAGTDGSVFLGLGGREFRMDSTADDFERGSFREYIMGAGPLEPNLPSPQIRVNNKDRNDPRKGFPLDTANLSRSPVYVRFEPEDGDDNWNLKFAVALVYADGKFFVGYLPPEAFDNLWLGTGSGKILFLTEEVRGAEQKLLAAGRKLAAAQQKRSKA
jgi:hypothetical protein